MLIRGINLEVPLIQGGMGVGVSLGGLAGAVAGEGAMGCISTADSGYLEPDFDRSPFEANIRGLRKEIRKAKEIRGDKKGLIAINAMVATTQFEESVRAAVEEGIDAVISGAGLPLELPAYVPENGPLIAPIVSSARAAKVILKSWERSYGRYPDFVVVEGYKAGGHLGFKKDDLLNGTCEENTEIVPAVRQVLAAYEEKKGCRIPVFSAGGVWDHEDFLRETGAGADGVQAATRFIGTYECDADQKYKDALIRSGRDDLRIIKSPVGMPGRAVKSPLLELVEKDGRKPPVKCSRCIKTCDPKTTPYCITQALIAAVKGDWENGLFFSGDNAERLTRMEHVSDVIRDIVCGA